MTRRSEYTHCYDSGQKLFSKHFVLFISERESVGLPWRLGMAVTKKTGSAVRRNRLRRLIREFFRLSQITVPCGFDFVVVPKKSTDPTAMSLAIVTGELLPLFKRGIPVRGKG